MTLYKLKMIREKTFKYETEPQVLKIETAVEVARKIIDSSDREIMLVMALDTKLNVSGVNIAHIGTLNASICHPREIFKFAILANASSIIIAHNHPSGNTEPSQADDQITQKINECGKLLGIELVDSIIIAEKGFYSYKQEGKL